MPKTALSIDPGASADLPAPRISEIVLKTSQFDVMRDWYQLALSATLTYEYAVPGGGPLGNNRLENCHKLCFLRLFSDYPFTQVIALFEIPGLQPEEIGTGLHHMQFRAASLGLLADRFERLAEFDIHPYKSFNHGPATSFYYEDPDKNLVEISGPNFVEEEDYKAFLGSPGFAKNPGGIEIDAKKFVSDLRAGIDRQELIKLPE